MVAIAIENRRRLPRQRHDIDALEALEDPSHGWTGDEFALLIGKLLIALLQTGIPHVAGLNSGINFSQSSLRHCREKIQTFEMLDLMIILKPL